jgi:hypothetical protein
MILDFDFRPTWQEGTWWIVETHIVEDISTVDDGIERLGDVIYFHKYQVMGDQLINGKESWIVDITAERLPPEFPNDHGNNPLWRFYIDKKLFILNRFEAAIRGRRYLVTGTEIQKTSYDFVNNNPVVINSVISLTPLDFPLLPSGEFPRFLSNEERDMKFFNQDTGSECWQHIDIIQEKIEDKPVKILYLTLSGDRIGIRTQKWIYGLPWWQEWRCTRKNGIISDFWYARLVDKNDTINQD